MLFHSVFNFLLFLLLSLIKIKMQVLYLSLFAIENPYILLNFLLIPSNTDQKVPWSNKLEVPLWKSAYVYFG